MRGERSEQFAKPLDWETGLGGSNPPSPSASAMPSYFVLAFDLLLRSTTAAFAKITHQYGVRLSAKV